MSSESLNHLSVVLEKEMSQNNYLYTIGSIWIMSTLRISLLGSGVSANLKWYIMIHSWNMHYWITKGFLKELFYLKCIQIVSCKMQIRKYISSQSYYFKKKSQIYTPFYQWTYFEENLICYLCTCIKTNYALIFQDGLLILTWNTVVTSRIEYILHSYTLIYGVCFL